MIQGFITLSRRALVAGIAATLTLAGAAAAAEQPVMVFAAASLTDALKAAAATWQAKGHGSVVLSFGSSSAIAKQVEAGAPADIFASADEKWMKYLTDKSLVDTATVGRPIGNDLVLVGAADSNAAVTIAPNFDLAGALNGGRLAIGDPKGVPAGTYAKAALTKLGVWDSIEAQTAPAENVRAALALVQRGEAPLGIVYATDARSAKGVKVVGTFPGDSHDPIVYPMGIVAGHDRPEVKAFFDFLLSDEGKALFKSYGFKTL
ncbi:MAG TPA: molybdate ABC transporter substrate-binding protein [Dongiaceae bacterium]|nr:molybdate ABC transporter substrate-binding protein [Dongiaceae bacterium]